ncbi:protein phosphatase 1 regulatory subunit 36 isoform X2 [Esox lucius]|uniref:Protein phosphatase 1 regulatory subunit 36 n=1 Tax=Esox lucius TaxID=8010 RepID=A0A3P8XH06_ESOLU|nr:protein phosphatase 1 regulatory subunit 36 isoform X2 [Esox lucius]
MPKLQTEKIRIPTPGRWNWNDETQSLEFIRFNKVVEVNEKRINTKPVNFQDLASKRPEGQMQTLAKRGGQSSKKTVGPALHTYKSSAKPIQRDYVTIEDVKQVALSLLQENELSIPPSFLPVLKSKELNDFLAALLLYLSCYFERKSLEKNPIPLMAEQSTSEMQVMTEALVKVELAQKQLALCYSSLVLGPGRFQQHHMARGRSHVSSTYKDRQLYECMYSFFCYVAWVTFSRNDLRGIQEEVGRLLRSDTFNPALRTRVDATEDTLLAQDTYSKEGQTDSKEHSQSHNATEQRKSQRRPALCKIMTQRSPLMVSLLPLPSEDAPHLFGRGRPRKQSQETLSDLESLMGELKDQLATFSFGILGKPFSQFSCTALMPKNEDEHDDDKEDADIHVRSDKTTYMAQRPVASSPDQRGSLNRADTNTSRATAGAVS